MFGRCRGGIVVRAIDCFDGHKFETSSRQKVSHHRITLIVIPERERERKKSGSMQDKTVDNTVIYKNSK